jgi:hypothetical protein
MDNRSTILNELREISPALAHNYLQQPYQAPEGYFAQLPEQVLQIVKGRFYQVPEGYFESLPDQIIKKLKGQIYEVPAGYFDSLPETILNRVKANEAGANKADDPHEELEQLSPLLKQIGKKTPFSLPEGYFSNLSENAIAGAQALDAVQEELSSPLLDGVKNKQTYEVPAGYFDQLPGRLLNKVQPARVVPMRFTKRILQYAAAAVVAGVIIITGWIYLGNNNTAATTHGELPPVVAANLDKISDEMLESYIENQNILPTAENVIIAGADDFDTSDLKEMLADVSDEDLQRYIERYNTAKDIITN